MPVLVSTCLIHFPASPAFSFKLQFIINVENFDHRLIKSFFLSGFTKILLRAFLETINGFTFIRFFGSFEPIFDSNRGAISTQLYIAPPKFEVEKRPKSSKNSTKVESVNSLLENACWDIPKTNGMIENRVNENGLKKSKKSTENFYWDSFIDKI